MPPQDGYDVAEIRNALGFTDADLIALLPARLQRWKGQDIAIRSLATATRQVPRLHLLLAGDALFGLEDDYHTELERLANRLGVSERLRFAGHREDLAGLYEASDMVLHTSREPEPYGLTVAEARAHGCAIVASDAGAIPEQMTHDRNGLLVKPGDPETLALAMVRLANQPELRRRLGEAAAADAAVTPTAAARQLEGLYDQVLER
jgi:glycosyltransferase involved in cell wall biosynthesis